MKKYIVFLLVSFMGSKIVLAKTCDNNKIANAIESHLISPQLLHNCELEYQKTVSLSRNIHGSFFQIYAKDLKRKQEAGIDLWRDQDCKFEYSNIEKTFSYTDTRFTGNIETRRQLQIKMSNNFKIKKLVIRSFQVSPYVLTEQVECSNSRTRRNYE